MWARRLVVARRKPFWPVWWWQRADVCNGWLLVFFFATSFGLAMISNDQQYAETDDPGFEVPLEAVEAAPLALLAIYR